CSLVVRFVLRHQSCSRIGISELPQPLLRSFYDQRIYCQINGFSNGECARLVACYAGFRLEYLVDSYIFERAALQCSRIDRLGSGDSIQDFASLHRNRPKTYAYCVAPIFRRAAYAEKADACTSCYGVRVIAYHPTFDEDAGETQGW